MSGYTLICPQCGARRRTHSKPDYERQPLCHDCYSDATPGGELGAQCAIDNMSVRTHPKCKGCGVLFGLGHAEQDYKDGRCEDCVENLAVKERVKDAYQNPTQAH